MSSAKDDSAGKLFASLQGSQPEPLSVGHPMVQRDTNAPSLADATDGPAESGTVDEKPSLSVVEETAPGPSKQPGKDHRAFIEKQLAEGAWEDDTGARGKRTTSPKPEPKTTVETSGARRHYIETSNSKLKTAASASRAAPADVDQLVGMDRRQIMNPHRDHCAIHAQGVRTSNMGSIIGNPFNATLGYSIKANIEAGRYGIPELKLFFLINKPRPLSKKDEGKAVAMNHSKTPRHRQKAKGKSYNADVHTQHVNACPWEAHAFTVAWRPGVRVQDSYMMEEMRIEAVTDSALGQHPHAQAIVNMCPRNKDGDQSALDKTIAMTFTTGIAACDHVEKGYWVGLPSDVRDTLDRIFFPGEPLKITIWLKTPPNPDFAILKWGKFLQNQVNNHVPPFAHYQRIDGTIDIDQETRELNAAAAKSLDASYPSLKEQIKKWDGQARRQYREMRNAHALERKRIAQKVEEQRP